MFSIVLHRYIVSRAMHDELVTELTAARILDIALQMGMEPACDLGLLGFRLTPDGAVHPLLPNRLQAALVAVRRSAAVGWIAHLAQHIDGRSVRELECDGNVTTVRPRQPKRQP